MMKQNLIRTLLLLGYAVPGIFLAMYCDITYHPKLILLLYVLALTAHGLLCRIGIRHNLSGFVILGNLLGFGTNYAFWLLHQTEQWNAYFKWLPSSGRMFSFLGISFAVQLWFLFNNYANQHWKKT